MAGRVDGNAAAIPKLPRTMFKEHVLQSEGVCPENITFPAIFQSHSPQVFQVAQKKLDVFVGFARELQKEQFAHLSLF